MIEANSLVYLYGFSTRKNSLLVNLNKIISEQISIGSKISIVLIHDGVIGTSNKSIIPSGLVALLNLPINFYALIPDLKARSINPNNLRDKIKGIDYDDLVDILVNNSKIISWM
ncbi:MAG: DsrH/TusB family sulfur relay protein [Candidatus Hodarchaeota archaeon]|jgi:sulfur relay protein TusB/DsrH